MTTDIRKTESWLIVVGLSLGVCVSNAFARFAYGLILPAMRDDLNWSYIEAGWINTSNAFGYIFGAILTMSLINRVAATRLFAIGMIVTSLTLVASGHTTDFWLFSLWRAIAGVSGALVFIVGGTLAAAMFAGDPNRNALAIALYFGGAGIGMILSGAALPGYFERYGTTAWPQSWTALGITSLVASVFAIWVTGKLPTIPPPKQSALTSTKLPVREMMSALVGYSLFGAGYIVYITFLVAWLRDQNATPATISIVWIVVGIGIVVSPFLWRSILARYNNGTPLALACLANAIGTLAPLFSPTATGYFVSAAIFGVSVFMVPSAATNFVRKNLPRPMWGRAIGQFTVLFAIGQTIGPVAAGAIGDLSGDITQGMQAAGLVLLAAAGASLFQRPIVRAFEAG